jgi:hypothetical protein
MMINEMLLRIAQAFGRRLTAFPLFVGMGCAMLAAVGWAASPSSAQEISGGDGGGIRLPIAGNPPLTTELLEKATGFFEWLLDAQLTREQRREFQESLAKSWTERKQDEIQSTVTVVQFSDRLNRMSPKDREAYRQVLQGKFLAEMRTQPGSMLARWVLNIYDSAHNPIAPGNPPLTRQMVDAYAEVVGFMLRESMGKQYFAANRVFKDALSQSLIAQYSRLAPQQQAALGQVPGIWAIIQARWPARPEAEKQSLRNQWRISLQQIVNAAAQSAPAANQAQASSGSLDQMVNKEIEHNWVSTMSQSIMTNTINLHMNMWH